MPSFSDILREVTIQQKHEVGGIQFYVRPVGEASSHYFGRNTEGYPCLLIKTPDRSILSSIRLALLEVNFSMPCRVESGEQKNGTEILTAIICKTNDRGIAEYFSHIAEVIIRILGRSPKSDEVAETVRRIVDLFESLSLPTGRSVAGLFGELYAIHMSQDPKKAVEAWHRVPGSVYDFFLDDCVVEVKTSTSGVRHHHFSLEQCLPPPGYLVVVLSILLESSGSGISLGELIRRIDNQMDADASLVLKIHMIVNTTLGRGALEAMNIRYDERLAHSSLRLFRIEDIPSIREFLPDEVSQVHFRSDLSNIPSVDVRALIEISPSISYLLPHTAG